jgi:hypothetical protein
VLQPDEVKSWVLTVLSELITAVDADGLGSTCHCDLYDDQTGDSPGRIASFEIEGGKLTWWNWRSDDACARAAWSLKLVCEFPEDERRILWIRERSWALDKGNSRRIVRV